MAKIYINESTLTDIGNAIRGKEGTTAAIPVNNMATRITALSTGANIPDKAFDIQGDCYGMFRYGKWDWFIENYGSKVKTNKLKNTNYMFAGSSVSEIPFKLDYSGSSDRLEAIFEDCTNLTSVPNISSCWPITIANMFKDCHSLRNVPDDLFESRITAMFCEEATYLFGDCRSLRKLPDMSSLKWLLDVTSYTDTYFYGGFENCYALDEAVNLPWPYSSSISLNTLGSTFTNCHRVKNITFSTDTTKSWKNQTLDLSKYVGYASYASHILNYNSGITSDKEVKDATTYAALKNDTDWYTLDPAYSRYNMTSALATINSLPSTSGSNTIKFKGESGSKTDGGAINTLSSSQIAVATAKGWTVSFV